MSGHRLLMSGPKLLRWEYDRGTEINVSRPRLIMSGPLPVLSDPEIIMLGPRLIMSGRLLVMSGPQDNYVGAPTFMSGPLPIISRLRDNYVGARLTVCPKKYAHSLCCILAERHTGLQQFAVYGSRVGLWSSACERHLLASGDTNNAPGVSVTPSRFVRLVILSVICFRVI